MKDLLKDFLQYLRNRNVSPHTLTAYENDVATFLQFTAGAQAESRSTR